MYVCFSYHCLHPIASIPLAQASSMANLRVDVKWSYAMAWIQGGVIIWGLFLYQSTLPYFIEYLLFVFHTPHMCNFLFWNYGFLDCLVFCCSQSGRWSPMILATWFLHPQGVPSHVEQGDLCNQQVIVKMTVCDFRGKVKRTLQLWSCLLGPLASGKSATML